MAYKSRRIIDRFFLVGGSLALGVGALIAAAAGDGERIGAYYSTAVVASNGSADVTEAIDYDFGSSDRHGIFRDVPGLDREAQISVSSATAPDQFTIEQAIVGTRLRIGDPNSTVDGRHRYVIDYPINLGFEDDVVSWNAVGAQWAVSISDIELHLIADRNLDDARCSQGPTGAWDGCEISQPEPGHLVVLVDKLDSFEGVTISARAGAPLNDVATLARPSDEVVDPGSGLLPPAIAAACAGLLAAAAASVLVRRNGQEQVWAGGSADAAFGPQFNDQYAVRRVDHDELNSLASTEFAPPKGLKAWQGGVLYSETVSKDHAVAWLMERAIAGEVDFEGAEEDLTMTLNAVDSPEHEALETLFGGRKTVKLGSYDKQFSSGWKKLEERINDWHDSSPYWDPTGDRNRGRTQGLGFGLFVVGSVALIISAVVANRVGLIWIAGVIIGALMAGAGWAMMIRSWELRVRTPEGSGLWILTESFRRFIHNSDAQHVDAAAKQGVLLDYTAWAVALGEVDRWTEAVESANLEGSASMAPQALYMTAMASNLSSAVSSTTTAPSSSGSGGGGSVGGGGGGGGGGSW